MTKQKTIKCRNPKCGGELKDIDHGEAVKEALSAARAEGRRQGIEEACKKLDLLARSTDLAAIAFAGMDRSGAYADMGSSIRECLADLEKRRPGSDKAREDTK